MALPTAKMTPWADGDALDSTNINAYIRLGLRFLLAAPICRVRNAVSVSCATSTWTDVTFTTEDIDTDPDGVGGHSTSSNTARYTARYDGWYQISGVVAFIDNSTGIRGVRWALNGSAISASEIVVDALGGSQPDKIHARTMHVLLDQGDYVTLQGFQNSGSSLGTYTGSAAASSMDVRWARARVGDV